MSNNKVYFVVLLVQVIYSGMFMLSKAAFNGGMNTFIFVFYRQTAATLFLSPLALAREWKTAPPLYFGTFCLIFIHSLFGIVLSMDIYGIAVQYTSASFSAASSNTLPAITFFLAVLFRMEAVKLGTKSGAAKLAGVVASIGGVAMLAFYQGPGMELPCANYFNGYKLNSEFLSSSTNSWVKGCFLMFTANTLWGLWLVFQARILHLFPSKLLLITLQTSLSTMQSLAIALAVERSPKEWSLSWDVKLLAILYCGILVTGVALYLQSWVIEKRGPVFLAMSTPINLILTTFCSAILLCEIINLGSGLGGGLMVAGLYCVLWGKSQEKLDDSMSIKVDSCTKEQEELNQNTVVADKV